ncbi:MAG: hypothetical protein ACJA0Z_003870 [Halioglobus sp.]|jgi:hypothetical protein
MIVTATFTIVTADFGNLPQIGHDQSKFAVTMN